MTPERTAQLLPILTAFAQGETVQFASDPNGPWTNADPANTDFDADQDLHWRIRPIGRTYRVALMQVPGKADWYPVLASFPPGVYGYSENQVVSQPNFIRWLTGTVEYEA